MGGGGGITRARTGTCHDETRAVGKRAVGFTGIRSSCFISVVIRVPTQTGKPRKMERHFPVREKSWNFDQIEKVRETHTKYWKTERI